MDPQRLALIAAMREDPDDDVKHLVYADWLEETGDPLHAARAELIRAQCAARRLPAGAEREAAARAVDALLGRLAWAWGSSDGNVLQFRRIDRGLTRYTLTRRTLAQFVERAADYHIGLPPEACVTVILRVTGQTDLAQLAGSPLAGRITGLRLEFEALRDKPAALARTVKRTVAQLAAGPWTPSLEVLQFDGAALSAAHVEALAASPELRGVTWLGFNQGSVVGALLEAAPWPGIKSLRIDARTAGSAASALAERYPPGVVRVLD